MAVGDLAELLCDGFLDFLVSVSQARYGCAAGRVEKFGPIFQEEVAAFAADGFLGHEAGVPVENSAGGCVCIDL